MIQFLIGNNPFALNHGLKLHKEVRKIFDSILGLIILIHNNPGLMPNAL